MILQFFTLEAPDGARTFSTNPEHNKLNEPLWTIQYEFTCYLLVPLLGLISVIKRKWLALLFFIVSYLVLLLQTGQVIVFKHNPRNWIFLHPPELPRLLTFFFAGSCVYFFRTYIKRDKLLILLSIALILFTSLWGQGLKVVAPFAGTYLVFCFAFDPRIQLHNFAKNGDFSYGLYLYGWPIQQLIMYFFGKYIDVNGLFFIAFPIALLAAFMSWHIVENPFLKMKGLIQKKTLLKRAA
jgi:peptidoglycan/LPS O-acetylase OafA/YrhL